MVSQVYYCLMSTRHKSGGRLARPRPSILGLEDCDVAKPAAAGLLLAVGTFVKLRKRPRIGEVSERLKELASKASVGETQPWVRIPPSPPHPLLSCNYNLWCLSWCLL